MSPSISFIDDETRKQIVELGKMNESFIAGGSFTKTETRDVHDMRIIEPGYRRRQFSHVMIEVILGHKELSWKKPGSDETVERRVNILHVFPNRVHADDSLKRRVLQLLNSAMESEFRIQPGHQDFCVEWIEEVKSFNVFLLGADHDPRVDDRLMRVGVLVNAGLDKSRVPVR